MRYWVNGDVVHGDKIGGDKVVGDKTVNVAAPAEPRRGRQREPKVVLIMSANADRQRLLSLDRERREIISALRIAQGRLQVQVSDAIQLDELDRSLQDHRPVIAHFSGHGSAAHGIMVTDPSGRPRAVSPDALSNTFRILRKRLYCVVLNACFTDRQARAIAQHIPCVIGMRAGILDEAAIDFAAGFYEGIAHSQSIRTSFELGCNRMLLHGHRDADRPELIAAPGADDLPVI
jgi:hypothetical protein